MKKILLLLFISFSCFLSCKKDDAASLKGKWKLESTVTKTYVNGTLTDTETEPGDGQTVDFRDNGVYVSSTPGDPDETGTYSIDGSKVTVDGQVADIQSVTSSKASLLYKLDAGGGNRVEILINLTR